MRGCFEAESRQDRLRRKPEQWLQGTWIRRFKEFRSWTGRPFQGRYKAIITEPGHAFAQVCHSIHLNPVRARIVGADEAGTYRWSSLRRFADPSRPAWLEPATVLREAGGLPDTPSGWKKYLAAKQCLLAAAMKRATSVSNTWLARRLEMRQPATASQGARR